ncbi:MAG: TolC family protein [Polyangiaceae bacterium]
MRRAHAAALLLSALAGCSLPLPTNTSARAHATLERIHYDEVEPFEGHELTIADAVARAKDRSVRLAEKRAAIEAARAESNAAGRPANPEIRVGGIRVDEIARDEPQVDLRVRFKPPRPGEAAAETAIADAAVREAEAALRSEELSIEGSVVRLFLEVQLADEELGLSSELTSIEARAAELSHKRGEEGRATSLDQALVDLDLSGRAYDSDVLAASRQSSLDALGALTGLSLPADITLERVDLAGALGADLPEERKLIELAVERAPELEKCAAAIDSAQARAALERSQQFPWFTFFDVGYVFEPSTDHPLGWLFGAGVDVPIFDTHQAAVDAALFEARAAELAFDAEVQRVADAVRAAIRTVKGAREAVARFDRGPGAAADKAAGEAQKALAAGRIDDLAELDVERRVRKVRLGRAALIRDYLRALGELERAAGWSPPLTTEDIKARSQPPASESPSQDHP